MSNLEGISANTNISVQPDLRQPNEDDSISKSDVQLGGYLFCRISYLPKY